MAIRVFDFMERRATAKTPKQWLIKILAEFTASVILAMILAFIGLFFGIQPNEVIKIQNSGIPVFIAITLVIYANLRCTFPVSDKIPTSPARK